MACVLNTVSTPVSDSKKKRQPDSAKNSKLKERGKTPAKGTTATFLLQIRGMERFHRGSLQTRSDLSDLSRFHSYFASNLFKDDLGFSFHLKTKMCFISCSAPQTCAEV